MNERLEEFIKTVKRHIKEDESWKEVNETIAWIEDERKYDQDPDGMVMDLMQWDF